MSEPATTTVRDVLLDMYERHGVLTPQLVLEESSDPLAPLHDRFEWDDTEAARKYRVAQAGSIIRSVKIKVADAKLTSPVRAFVHIPAVPTEVDAEGEDSAASYVPADEVRDSPAMTALALAQMDREWRYMRRRYETYKEFWSTVSASVQEAVTQGKATPAAATTASTDAGLLCAECNHPGRMHTLDDEACRRSGCACEHYVSRTAAA